MGNCRRGLFLISSLAASIAVADVAVGFRQRGVVDVPAGTAVSARTLIGDRGVLNKTGAGTLDVAAAGLRASSDARLAVLEGAVAVDAGTAVDLAAPPAVCYDAAYWVDMSSLVASEGGAVEKWCDRRETDPASPKLIYAVPKWYGSDALPALKNGEPPVRETFQGQDGVFFGGATSGQFLRWRRGTSELSALSVHHLFIVHAITNWIGHPVGGETAGRLGPLLTTVGSSTPAYSATATLLVNRGDVCPPQASARFRVDGAKCDPRTAPAKRGWQLLECDYCDILPKADNFYRSGFSETLKGRQGGDYLGEVLVFTNQLTAAQCEQVSRYLLAKWDLPNTANVRPRTPAVELALAADTAATVAGDAGTVTPPLAFAGAGDVSKTGAGTLVLGPTDLEFAGDFDWTAGRILLQGGRLPALMVRAGEKFAFSRISGSNDPTPAGDAVSGITCDKSAGAAAGTVETTGNGWLRVHTVDPGVRVLKVGMGTADLGSVLQLEGRVRAVDAPEAGGARATFANPDLELPTTLNDLSFDRYKIAANSTAYGWTARVGTPYIMCFQAPQPNAAGKNTWSQWLSRSYLPPTGTNMLQLVQKTAVSTTVSVPKAGVYELSFDGKSRYTSHNEGVYNKGYPYPNQQLQLDILFGRTWDAAARVGTVQVGCVYFNRFRLRIAVPEAGTWELGLQSDDNGWDGCTFLDNFEMVRVAEPAREVVHPVPNGTFERLVRPARGGSPSIANPWIHGRFTTENQAEGWTFEINRTDDVGKILTNGVIGVVTTGTGAKKSNMMQMFPLAEEPVGGGALMLVSTGGVASTTFSVPAGTWRLRGALQRWATYWACPPKGDTYMQGSPSVRATVVRGDGTTTDLGVVQQTTQNLDTHVWPTAFTASEGETVTLRIEQTAGGVSAIGILTGLELVRDDTRADNLVQDPGFEKWSGFWESTILPSPYTGRPLGYCWVGRYGNASDPVHWGYCAYAGDARLRLQNAGVAYQDVAVPAAGRYRFKMHVRARADSTWYANNPVRVWLARGGVTNVLATTPTLFSRNWMEVSYLVDVPEAGTWRLGLEGRCRLVDEEREIAGGSRADLDAHVDEVSLVRCTDVIDAAPSLPSGLRIEVAKGAQLLLDYSGTAKCGPVTYDGQLYLGTIDAATHPEFVTGPGALEAISPGTIVIFR